MATQRPMIHIGLSGWSYPGWRNGFYKGVPQRRWLAHCAAHFDTIEANGTFYRLPKPGPLRRWRGETPDGFTFVAKGHRMVTHIKRLNDPADSIVRQRDALKALGDKLGAVLWQLPASLKRDDDRLAALIAALRRWRGPRHAIEFRDRSWFCRPVADALRDAGIANCVSDASRWPLWSEATADLVYIRLHGHSQVYASRYADASLRRWAARIRRWRTDGHAVHVYFDNDAKGHAPYDALRLKDILGQV